MFNERLKQARIDSNLSQEKVAELLNTSRSNISKYETGYLEPNISTLKDLCKLYKVSADYLLELDEIINNNISINQSNNQNANINFYNK